MEQNRAVALNAGLSDRMSRSEMALLLPSPPTALQVMMADIENGIIEAKNLHFCAECYKWAAWALPVATAVWPSCFMVLPGVRGWFDDGVRGYNPPPISGDSRVQFGV